jgi:preprotein translocase subunit SecG
MRETTIVLVALFIADAVVLCVMHWWHGIQQGDRQK